MRVHVPVTGGRGRGTHANDWQGNNPIGRSRAYPVLPPEAPAAQPSPNWGKVPAFGEGLRPDIADRGLLLVVKRNPMANKQSPLLGLTDHQPDHRNALPDIAANGYADHLGDHQTQP